MLYFKLDKIMDERKLSINKVSSEADISRPALTAMYNNDSKGVQFETLEKLMKYLNVSLGDLIGEKKEQNIFSFKPTVSIKGIIAAEKTKTDSESNNGFVQVLPSRTLPYDAILLENGTLGEKFNFAITPVDNYKNISKSTSYLQGKAESPNLITSLLITFYRADGKGKQKNVSDINAFLGKLNTEATVLMVESIFKSWLSVYKLLNNNYKNELSELLLIDINLIGNKTRIPLVAKTNKNSKSSDVSLDFSMFKASSKLKGNDTYSSHLEFKEIPENVKMPD
ncbi:hypothetical protein EsVE80_04570 [Enterococcus saigonensis]|uniref:HTH cro/C1-type domain-containing protein n=1 Tax=Enterococcus saigonensis TaxID=1805431 RepID=A0A679IMD3_9ENTE|nr:helix-turn-helix transcriptional regulator [Enterococcus saigonensis]BCA84934.1 hypothetical protein EsVE80_04570 [Enterococcus saigonensis]